MSYAWRIEEDTFLIKYYSLMPVADISTNLGRTKNAVYNRGKVLKLKRAESGLLTGETGVGNRFQPGNKPWNHNPSRPPNLRDLIMAELAEHIELTGKQLAAAVGSTRTACWRVCQTLCNERAIHVARWDEVPGGVAAVYRVGIGKNAVKPETSKHTEDPYKVLPVPRPAIGLWGLSWPKVAGDTAAQGFTTSGDGS